MILSIDGVHYTFGTLQKHILIHGNIEKNNNIVSYYERSEFNYFNAKTKLNTIFLTKNI